jgi:hypothetical protein
MSRPTVEVAEIVRTSMDRFLQQSRSWLSFQQLKVLQSIARCRTAALGGHIDSCSACGHRTISYNSCRDRHCPKCQAQARERWLTARDTELLSIPYFHVVFTVPHQLNALCQYNPKLLYGLLLQTSAATLLEVGSDPKHLGAEIGFLSILHTWGQNLSLHPHVHCAIPAGGISPDHTHWVHPRYTFFLPVKVLSRVFRGKFTAGHRRLHRHGKLRCSGPIATLAEPKRFAAFLRTLFREDWVVYAKPAFGGPTQVLRYLGRYTHRVAISNHRLLDFDGQGVTFRWRDYAHGNKRRKMTLTSTEFLRRFVQHVLPRGFVRIRQYGFLANRSRSASLTLARQLLTMTPKPREPCHEPGSGRASWLCPRCGTSMIIGPNLSPRQLARQCESIDSS